MVRIATSGTPGFELGRQEIVESAADSALGGGAVEVDQSSTYGGRNRRQSVLRVDAEAVEVRAPRPDGAPQRLAVGWSRADGEDVDIVFGHDVCRSAHGVKRREPRRPSSVEILASEVVKAGKERGPGTVGGS